MGDAARRKPSIRLGARCRPTRDRDRPSGTQPLPQSQRGGEYFSNRQGRRHHRPKAEHAQARWCWSGLAQRSIPLHWFPACASASSRSSDRPRAECRCSRADPRRADFGVERCRSRDVVRGARRAAQREAIIYISHRLEELMRIGDYVTVLRDGRRVEHAPIAEVSVPWIVERCSAEPLSPPASRAAGRRADTCVARRQHAPRGRAALLDKLSRIPRGRSDRDLRPARRRPDRIARGGVRRPAP